MAPAFSLGYIFDMSNEQHPKPWRVAGANGFWHVVDADGRDVTFPNSPGCGATFSVVPGSLEACEAIVAEANGDKK